MASPLRSTGSTRWRTVALVLVALLGVGCFALAPFLPRLIKTTTVKDHSWTRYPGQRKAEATVTVRFAPKGGIRAQVDLVLRLARDDPLVARVRSGGIIKAPEDLEDAFAWIYPAFGPHGSYATGTYRAPVLTDRGDGTVTVRTSVSYDNKERLDLGGDVARVEVDPPTTPGLRVPAEKSLSFVVRGGTVTEANRSPTHQDQRTVRYDRLPAGSLRLTAVRDGTDPVTAVSGHPLATASEAIPLGMFVAWLVLLVTVPRSAGNLRLLVWFTVISLILSLILGTLFAVVSAITPMAAVAIVHDGRKAARAALACGGAGAAFMIAFLAGLNDELVGAAALPIVGLLWAPYAFAVTRIPPRSLPWKVGLIVALPVIAAFVSLGPPDDEQTLRSGVTVEGYWPGYGVSTLLQALVLVAALVILAGLGRGGAAVTDRLAWAAGLAWSVAALSGRYGMLPAIAGVAVALWLLPRRDTERVDRLAAVTPTAHARLMRLEARRRLLQAAARIFSRDARSLLATGALTSKELATRLHRLEADSRPRPRPTLIGLTDAALDTGGGFTPWQNAKAALRVGLLLNLPYVIFYARQLAYLPFDIHRPIFNVQGLPGLLQLAMLALVFGYFYPSLRGHGPLGKATWMLSGTLLAQLAAAVSIFVTGFEYQAAVWLGINVGNTIAFWLILGLYWEYRMARAAGLPWSALRDIRSVKALGAPLTAALVAAVTALASTTATAWLPPPPSSQEQQGR